MLFFFSLLCLLSFSLLLSGTHGKGGEKRTGSPCLFFFFSVSSTPLPSAQAQPAPTLKDAHRGNQVVADRQTDRQADTEMNRLPHQQTAMETRGRSGSILHRFRSSGDAFHASLLITLLLGVWSAQALEVSVGKVPFVEAMNGSTVLLPCTYSSCIGIKNLYFNWQYNDNGTMQKLCEAVIPAEGIEPNVLILHDRVEFVGSSKRSNISILLKNITFEDEGQYICFARNPKEKNRNHSAIFTLFVVEELKEVDDTLTVIIIRGPEKNKECLVSSSGNDNTENGLSGSKTDNKATPKQPLL
ncbi:sodium channel, voltage-gated, type IV, beta a isoform X1 [Denticeps clupeoides]|uniref:sodium channel, voltage-gated, type IV, beta a isoform X1 n=1 Tax=Denticeps clupeoides TaxID=299321 RepID=UPI0010A2BEE3|nr:sodium channel subunit beta-4 isoform X1 [Denticeps clupeoides]